MSISARIDEMIEQPPSEERARALYTLGVAAFQDVQAGLEGEELYAAMHRAFVAAADSGLADAWVELGRCRWNGWGTTQDRDGAMEAYRRAAELGSHYAAFACASNHYWYYENYEEAMAYAERALAGGDRDGNVHYLLGLMAYGGRGRAVDHAESRRLHAIAAERGDADAMFELYVYDSKGIAGKVDNPRAIEWLRRAAEKNQTRACYSLGAHLCGGNGVERNVAEGMSWYERAAELGHGRAAAMLGAMYLFGDGVEVDDEKGEEWLGRAAALGFDVDAFLDELRG